MTTKPRAAFGIGVMIGGLLRTRMSHLGTPPELASQWFWTYHDRAMHDARTLGLGAETRELFRCIIEDGSVQKFLGSLPRFMRQVEDRCGRRARFAVDLALTLQDCKIVLVHIQESIDHEDQVLLPHSLLQLAKNKHRVLELVRAIEPPEDVRGEILERMELVAGDDFDTVDTAEEQLGLLIGLLWENM